MAPGRYVQGGWTRKDTHREACRVASSQAASAHLQAHAGTQRGLHHRVQVLAQVGCGDERLAGGDGQAMRSQRRTKARAALGAAGQRGVPEL